MVKGIRIQNFKAFTDSGWVSLNKINYVMGPNSSGKSSIGKAIIFAKNLFDNHVVNNDYGIPYSIPLDMDNEELGRFGSTVYDGATSFKISYKIQLDKNDQLIGRSSKGIKKLISEIPWLLKPYVIEFQFVGQKNEYSAILKNISFINFNSNQTILSIKNYESKYILNVSQSALVASDFNKQNLLDVLKNYDVILTSLSKKFNEAISPIENLLDVKKLPDYSFSVNKGVINSSRFRLPWLMQIILESVNKIQTKNYDKIISAIKGFETPNLDERDYKNIINRMRKKQSMHHAVLDYQSQDNVRRGLEMQNDFRTFVNHFSELYDPSIFLGDILMNCADVLSWFHSNIVHIGPTRNMSLRQLDINPKKSGDNIWARLYKDKFAKKKIKYVIDALGDENIQGIKFKDKWDKFFTIQIKGKSGKWRNLHDIGFGFGQILPVLFKCLDNFKENPLRHSFFIIEEPEVHLHPKLASYVANFFIKLSEEYEPTLFVETHSEHLILNHQLQIKKNPKLAEKTQILFMERVWQNKGAFSQIHKVTFEEDGQLTESFPDDFFDLSFKQYQELMK